MVVLGRCGEAAAGGPCGRRKGHEGHHATIAAHHLDENDDLRTENERLLASWSEADALWIAAKAEVERLREAIRTAPHAQHCAAHSPIFPGRCGCWKVRALARASDEEGHSDGNA